MAELLFWPALLLYGEAAVGYFGDVRRPGRAGRVATWGVRLGWLAQTALLAVQAARRRRVPVGDVGRVAPPLRLARRLGVPDLGLPPPVPGARPRRDAARRGAARRRPRRRRDGNRRTRATTRTSSSSSTSGLVLAAFAGFTLAAALSALYVWQERRLKTPPGDDPPPADAGARDARRARLADGRVVGAAPDARRRGRARAPGRPTTTASTRSIAATAATWLVWCAYLGLRLLAGWAGRRAAYLALAGFALVVVVRLALPATHFA